MRELVTCFALLIAAGAAAAGEKTAAPDGASYVFTLDGKPCSPGILSLRGDPARPQPGDLVCIDRIFLTLGPERECHFVSTPDTDGRLLVKTPSGKLRVVGAILGWSFEDDKTIIHNPLEKLSAQEIHGLWGIVLEEWPQGIDEKLEQIDMARTCLTLTDRLGSGGWTARIEGGQPREKRKLPFLPSEIQYLSIAERSNQGYDDYTSLRGLSRLRFLSIRSLTATPFDARLIAQNRSLRRLDLTVHSLQHPRAVGQLSQMEWLGLDGVPDLATVEFVSNMSRLRHLGIARTKVRDLSPIAGLTSLETLSASKSLVEELPEQALPGLRTLEVFSTRLTDAAVAAFAKLNPQCAVRFRWDEALRKAVAKATRLRIRSGGTCQRQIAEEKTLWELKDAAASRDFAAFIRIEEKGSGFHCMCCGDPSFEFYEGDRLITTLGFHHGRSLRWPGNWPGDGLLAAPCAAELPAWFARHGYRAFQQARQEEVAAEQRARQQRQAFLACYPEQARKLFDIESADAGLQQARAKEIVKVIGDPVGAAVASFRALGSDIDYGSFGGQMAVRVLEAASDADFSLALKKHRGDAQAELGAARLYFAPLPPKEVMQIEHRKDFWEAIPQADRSQWMVDLARIEMERDSPGYRFVAVRRLIELDDAKTGPLLRQIARGEFKGSTGWESGNGEPGVRGAAYVGLAQLQDPTIRSEVEKLVREVPPGADRAALEISLALLGEPQYIRREHFQFESYVLGYAAIRAIESFNGREGMDVLVEAGIEHPWAYVSDEAFQAILRITGQTWKDDRQGKNAMKAWWREHGKEFVASRRAQK